MRLWRPGDRQAIFGPSTLALCYLAPALLPAVARMAHTAEHAFFAVLVKEVPPRGPQSYRIRSPHVHQGDAIGHEHGSIVSGLLASLVRNDEIQNPESRKQREQRLNPHVLVLGPTIPNLQLPVYPDVASPFKNPITPARAPLVPPPRGFGFQHLILFHIASR